MYEVVHGTSHLVYLVQILCRALLRTIKYQWVPVTVLRYRKLRMKSEGASCASAILSSSGRGARFLSKGCGLILYSHLKDDETKF